MKDVKDSVSSESKQKDTKSKGYNRNQKGGTSKSETKTFTKGNPRSSVAQQRLKDVTALNFDYPISQYPIHMDTAMDEATVYDYNVNVVKYVPTLGASDAANLASQKWFGELRKILNVPSTYEAGDLFMYNMAVEQLDLAVEAIKRVIRTAATYNPVNIQLPKAVLRAMGFDYDEIINHLPQYREAVNKTLTAMRYLTIPYLTQSHSLRMNLNHFIYRDADDPKSQNIVFVPEGFWKWDLTAGTSTTPSDLLFVRLGATGANSTHCLSDVKTLLSTLLESLLYDETGQRIHGDILKVWGDKLILGGDPIKEDETQEFKFDPYILYMLHNATIHHGIGATDPKIEWVIPAGSTSPTIRQSVHVDTFGYLTQRHIIDAWPQVTSDDIVNLCRWKSVVTGDASTNTESSDDIIIGQALAMPLEVLTEMDLYYFTDDGSFTYVPWTTTIVMNGETLTNFVRAGTLAMAPIVVGRSAISSNGVTSYRVSHLLGDRNYYTIVNANYLYQLDLVATEFNYSL